MLKNLFLTQGLIMSETFMFALGEKIGKQKAHEAVYELSMKAVHEGKSFLDVIQEDPEMKKFFPPEQLGQLLNPSAHTGLASEVVEKVLDALQKNSFKSQVTAPPFEGSKPETRIGGVEDRHDPGRKNFGPALRPPFGEAGGVCGGEHCPGHDAREEEGSLPHSGRGWGYESVKP